MDFYDVLDQVLDLLRQRGRVTYNALKRQFGLDDACLQDLKDEIIEAQRVAVDENDRVLVWTGDVAALPPLATASAAVQARPPDAGPQGDLVHRDVVWPLTLGVKRPGRIEVSVGRSVQLGGIALQGMGAELFYIDCHRSCQTLGAQGVEA